MAEEPSKPSEETEETNALELSPSTSQALGSAQEGDQGYNNNLQQEISTDTEIEQKIRD